MRRAAWLLSGCFAVGLILLLEQGCGPVPQRVEVASTDAGMEQSPPGDSLSTGTTTFGGRRGAGDHISRLGPADGAGGDATRAWTARSPAPPSHPDRRCGSGRSVGPARP